MGVSLRLGPREQGWKIEGEKVERTLLCVSVNTLVCYRDTRAQRQRACTRLCVHDPVDSERASEQELLRAARSWFSSDESKRVHERNVNYCITG